MNRALTLTTEEEEALVAATDRYNTEAVSINPRFISEKPDDFYLRHMRHIITHWVTEYRADQLKDKQRVVAEALADPTLPPADRVVLERIIADRQVTRGR